MDNKLNNSREKARKIAAVLVEKKALDIKLYEVLEASSITDYYVNASGRSNAHVASLADEVCEQLSKFGVVESRIEGRGANSWLLVDYGDVIVNIFDRQSREFYDFDRLLPKESQLSIEDIVAEIDEKLKITKIEEQ